MSTLRHYNWEHEINFNDGSVTHLFLENPITMREYAYELLDQIENGAEGNFVLSEDATELSIQKNIAIITDPINLKFDEKKINAKINKDLLTVTNNPGLQKDFFPLISLLEQYAMQIVDDYKMSISYEIPEQASIIKMLGFHINTEYSNLSDKLLEWMNITHDLLGIGNFIILNLNMFFSNEEISLLCSECSSLKHNLLLIDQYNRYEIPKSITIDIDNCELF